MNVPAHSDLIIHWTGHDLDDIKDKSLRCERYVERLRYILKYGLWMTLDEEDNRLLTLKGNTRTFMDRPACPRTCFTELKLSLARQHAARFGCLGIGFKRFFLFHRLGAPMVYYMPHSDNWLFPYHLGKHGYDDFDYFSNFLKPMTDDPPGKKLSYNHFNESEWRIIYSENIRQHLISTGQSNMCSHFTSPSDIDDPDFQEYIEKAPSHKRPHYLIPVKDVWFYVIIYPDIPTKILSERDEEIRDLINNIKLCLKDGEHPKWNAFDEKFNKPMEMTLQDSSNF